MRWSKRSARDEILKDISFDKRGQVAEHGGGGEGSSARQTGKQGLTIAVFLIILIFGGVFLYGYVSGERGQRQIAEGLASVYDITIDPIFDALAAARGAGSGEYFSTRTNATSSKQGIDLADLVPITGEVIPAGRSFDLRYDIAFENVDVSDGIDTTFSCSFNTTDNKQTVFGDILPSETLSLRKGTSVYCRINGEDTETLDGPIVVSGWFTFPYQTKDATLPVYLITGDVADQLGDEDFFEGYDLDVSRSDLRVTYNGEPISVAIGTGGEGDEEQPVIVRSGDDVLSYNTVGITLTNEWDGDIVNLKSMTLYLPSGIELDDELNQEPSATGCPLVRTGSFREFNTYTLSDAVAQELLAYYFDPGSALGYEAFFGKEDRKTFQCWIRVDPDLFAGAPYIKKDYVVDIEYEYKVKDEKAAISIKKTEESLVA